MEVERVFRNQEEANESLVGPRAVISMFVALLFLMAVPGGVIDPNLSDDGSELTLSPIEAFEIWKSEEARIESQLPDGGHNSPTPSSNIPSGPYPEISPDGRPMGNDPPRPQSTPFWQNLSTPPNNTGGGYSYDSRSSLGEYQVGATSELYIGDVNGNGVLEGVSYYFHRPSSINGLDDDGDGCIDELTYGDSTGQTGCDMIPDAMVYFETGAMPVLGGSNGDLIVLTDYVVGGMNIEIFKIGASVEWNAHRMRGLTFSPYVVGDFISYYAYEEHTNINANPEMDNDLSDMYVGSIDARMFPMRSPVNHVCSAGKQLSYGSTHMRQDGWIVGGYNLIESFDDHDWNGDGDIKDEVVAYYAVDPITGGCRQGVNGGVAGFGALNRGTILTPLRTSEYGDNRDWNNDLDLMDAAYLYLDINSTWPLKGRIYTSYTYTAPVPQWGFGWWAMYNDDSFYYSFPLAFGGIYTRYIGPPQQFKSYFWLINDEDGDRHTKLPGYEIEYGQTGGTFGGSCALIYAREWYLDKDVTGDGDKQDTVSSIFCPNVTGGGGVWVTKGPIIDGNQTYWEFQGYYYYRFADYIVEDSQGKVAMPFFVCEGDGDFDCAPVDLDGDNQWVIPNRRIHLSYLFEMP
jgi:hypothetical protein